MSTIKELIKQYCPHGVDYIKLGNVSVISNGERPSKDLSEGAYPYINAGTSPSGLLSSYNSEGNAITTPSHGEGGIGYVGFQPSPFWCGALCFKIYAIEGVANARYLYHLLSSKSKDIRDLKKEGGVPYYNRSQLESIIIPVPPLPVQQEIVRILDSFTNLQDNLKQELDAREKQYRFYLDLLFSNAQGQLMTLGDIGIMKKGTGIQKADFVEEGFPCIHYGQVHTYYGTSTTKTKSFVRKEVAKSLATYGDLIIATTSEDVEACCKAVAWLGDTDVAVSGDAHIFHHNQNPKYISYLFQSEEFAAQKRMNSSGAKVVRVHGDAMLKFLFRIPPLDVQQKVVDALEQFEGIIKNIKEELSARQKQYEYYREQLLTFPTI